MDSSFESPVLVGFSRLELKTGDAARRLGETRAERIDRIMAEVNGLLVDLRDMPRDVQEIAFAKGLIPYIPADRKDRS